MSLKKNEIEKVQRKLDIFIANKIKTLMPNLLNLRNDREFTGAAAGLTYFLNNLGIVMKSEVLRAIQRS